MKAVGNSREDRARLPCRKRPGLCVTIYTFMFVPAIAAELVLGRLLTQLIPRPGLLAILSFTPVFVILFITGMLLGAVIWLLLMKRFVDRGVLAEFFLGDPRIPIFSSLCSKIFVWAYAGNQPAQR